MPQVMDNLPHDRVVHRDEEWMQTRIKARRHSPSHSQSALSSQGPVATQVRESCSRRHLGEHRACRNEMLVSELGRLVFVDSVLVVRILVI